VPLHPSHYERLGLAEDADAEQVEAATLRAAAPADAPAAPPCAIPGTGTGTAAAVMRRTPGPGADERELAIARAVLSDPLRRAVYDAWLLRERQAARRSHWGRHGWPGVLALASLLLALGVGALLLLGA
jgi:hypothetical protein